MPNITKPLDINKIWASAGDVLAPSDSKIALGWQVEIPPRQYFNYIDNKQDQAIAHINQHGIAQWDSVTEYQASTSYTQGSDGQIYKAKQTHSNQNPVLDTTFVYWEKTYQSASEVTAFINSLFTGTGKALLTTNGYQKIPGSNWIVQWGQYAHTSGSSTVNFPISFPTAVFSVTTSDIGAATWTPTNVTTNGVANKTLGGFTGRSFTWNGSAFVAGNAGCTYIAVGY